MLKEVLIEEARSSEGKTRLSEMWGSLKQDVKPAQAKQ